MTSGQESSDPETQEFNLNKKIKAQARAKRLAKAQEFRDQQQKRGRGKTSSDEDPDFRLGGDKGRKKKRILDSDDDLDDRDFKGGAKQEDSDDSDRNKFADLTNKDKSDMVIFFNDATPNEIMHVPGLSKKKTDVAVSLRPFQNWKQLREKFASVKSLNENMLVDAQVIIEQRKSLMKFMKNCENLAAEIEETVKKLQDCGETDDTEDLDIQIVKQPQLLNKDLKLKPYQIIGINWLYIMFKNNTNAILSDEMGLGKTIQTIAFLAYLKENGELRGKQMIVGPASTIENWQREFQTWCPDLKVFMYYGGQDERTELRRAVLNDEIDYEVVLTTYNICYSNKQDKAFFKKLDLQYMVIDEGHMLKNMASLRYQNLMKIKAECRLLLTGTPLQNNLVELISVLTFVMPTLFAQHAEAFKIHFQSNSSKNEEDDSSSFEKARIDQAKAIMKPFMLRRLKRDVIKQLPPKKEVLIKCQMNESQRENYNNVKAALAKSMKDKSEGVGRDNTTLSNVMMQLRKATNHKLLHRRLFTLPKLKSLARVLIRTEKYDGCEESDIIEDLTAMSDFDIHQICMSSSKTKKFLLDEEDLLDSAKIGELDKLLPGIKEKGEKVLLFSQFVIVLDILQEYLEIRKHKFVRLDGSTSVDQRLLLIDEFNSTDCFVFLLSTRAGGLGINLATANHVIIHDIDFNPYNDKQAEDRAHRVGQQKIVTGMSFHNSENLNSIPQVII